MPDPRRDGRGAGSGWRTSTDAAGVGQGRAVVHSAVLDHPVWLILAIILIIFSLTIEHFCQIGIFRKST